MSSEFDEATEAKDYTKYIWAGVVIVFVLMVAAIWVWGRPSNAISVVRFRHILISFKPGDAADRARALESITKVRDRLAKGESFAYLAKTFSTDPSSSDRGGDVGWIRKGQLDPVVEGYVWNAPLHKLSDILEGKKGFYLVEVLERRMSPADLYEKKLKLREEDKIKAESAASSKKQSSSPAPAAK